jgi:hypothetical protein
VAGRAARRKGVWSRKVAIEVTVGGAVAVVVVIAVTVAVAVVVHGKPRSCSEGSVCSLRIGETNGRTAMTVEMETVYEAPARSRSFSD